MNDKNIEKINNLKLANVREKIRQIAPIYLFVLLGMFACAGYFFYKSLNYDKLVGDANEHLKVVNNKAKRLIIENNALKKTQAALHSISKEKNTSLRSYTKDIEEAINDLAYYYNISGPISATIAYPSKYESNVLTKIRLDISINTYDDEAVIQFIESLIINFRGFIKIQEMSILKNKEALFAIDNNDPITSKLIKCELELDWYVLVSNTTGVMKKKKVLIYPKRPDIKIEDIYRTSIWEGSLMLSEDHLRKINLLHETWE